MGGEACVIRPAPKPILVFSGTMLRMLLEQRPHVVQTLLLLSSVNLRYRSRLVSWTDGDGSSMVCADSPDVLMVYCAVSRLRVHFLDLVPSVRFESADIQCVATLAGRNRSGPLRGQAFCSWQRTARWKCYQCTAADGLLFRIFEYCPRTILFQSWRIFRL